MMWLEPPFNIDMTSGLVRGLLFDCFPAYGPKNNARQENGQPSFTYGTGITVDIGRYGRQITYSGAQASNAISFSTDALVGLDNATECSFEVLYFAPAGGASGRMGRWSGSGSDQQASLFLDASPAMAVANGAGTVVAHQTTSPAVALGAWNHIVCTWKATATFGFYVNGKSYASSSIAGSSVSALGATPSAPFSLCSENGGGQVIGSTVYVRVWNRALSQGEAVALYQNPRAIYDHRRAVGKFIATVIARPSADSIDGNWVNQVGSNVNLFASIDEAVVDDADYIRSEDNPVADVTKIKLEAISVPVQEPFRVRYRYKKSGTGTIDLTVRLLEDVTVIAEWEHTNISDSFVTLQQTLTTPEFAAITDFTDLYLEFEANLSEPSLLLDDGTSFLLLDDGVTTLGIEGV